MMDEIAGHVGFYEPIFGPAFREAGEGNPLLKFCTVQAVIDSGFPTASFQATLFQRTPSADASGLCRSSGPQKEVKRRIENKTLNLFADDEPPPVNSRAVMGRGASSGGGRIVHDSEEHASACGRGDPSSLQRRAAGRWRRQKRLGDWESQGKPLERRAVIVEARKVADRVIAILQPVEARRKRDDGRRSQFSRVTELISRIPWGHGRDGGKT